MAAKVRTITTPRNFHRSVIDFFVLRNVACTLELVTYRLSNVRSRCALNIPLHTNHKAIIGSDSQKQMLNVFLQE